MNNYLDLLPEELLEIIDNMVLNLYKQDHYQKISLINRELNMLWLYSLWCAGFNNNNLIENIYLENFKFNESNTIFTNLINITKYNKIIPFIKPSLLKYLKIRKHHPSNT
tara:strand:+ start:121 stop:450 length:330 start_codon:yes stop_codon:yes gene_type:complete